MRSRTYDIKTCLPWKYFDNLCVVCETKAETMEHFLSCSSYENVAQEHNWKAILENRQFEIANIVKARQKYRKNIIDKYEAGHLQVSSGSRQFLSSVIHIFTFVCHFCNYID